MLFRLEMESGELNGRVPRRARLLAWHKEEGDLVTPGDDLLDLQVEEVSHPAGLGQALALRSELGASPSKMATQGVDARDYSAAPGPGQEIEDGLGGKWGKFVVRVTAADGGILRKIRVRSGEYASPGDTLALLTIDIAEPVPGPAAATSGASRFRAVQDAVAWSDLPPTEDDALSPLNDLSDGPTRWDRIRLSIAEIVALVPETSALILMDEQDWGATEYLLKRRVFPFIERGGRYWGRPADDLAAIRELERLRGVGAEFLVLTWPAFWWLEYYAAFARQLRSAFPCRVENDRIIVFDLRGTLD